MNKNNFIIYGMIFLMVILFVNLISAADPLYCCEKLKNNVWCQESAQSDCATGVNPFSKTAAPNNIYRNAQTLCQYTSYCTLGTCINQIEGSCMPNTPQVVCDLNNGTWKNKAIGDLDECKLGCCILGNQVAFVTQTACKTLTAAQGLIINFRPDIQTELECIASVTSDEIGACVYEKDYQRTCEMISQTDCKAIDKSEFHKGYLCSAQQLTTNCGPSKETICKDEKVYFMDTCGNAANVYDASKINDYNDYWTYIQDPTCDDGNGNKNSVSCGACDYFAGSMCKAYDKTKPTYGSNVCASLDCTYNGQTYLHGETWCADNSKSTLLGQNLPGSRYFRMMCYNGEVTVEPCSEYRNEICIQDEVNNFKTAACVVNRWQDCTIQTKEEDCLDIYSRDCKWISGYSMLKNKTADGTVQDLGKDENNIPGSCVPNYSSGFDAAGTGNGPELCSQGSAQCVVTYKIGLLGPSKGHLSRSGWATKKKYCVKNCQCIPDGSPENLAWISLHDNICMSLGDCGNKQNYLGYFGENKSVFTSEFIKNP
jgi:hypothetical protein